MFKFSWSYLLSTSFFLKKRKILITIAHFTCKIIAVLLASTVRSSKSAWDACVLPAAMKLPQLQWNPSHLSVSLRVLNAVLVSAVHLLHASPCMVHPG